MAMPQRDDPPMPRLRRTSTILIRTCKIWKGKPRKSSGWNRLRRCCGVLAAFALLLVGCQYGEVAHGWSSLSVERIQFSKSTPASFRALVEKPVLSGARAGQQKAVDEWIAEVASFGNCSNATVEVVLDTMSARLAENVATAKREAEGEPWQMEAIAYWYFDLDAQIAYADAEYLAYQVCLDEFEGWLHPFRNYNWRVWSFERGRELSPEDIFKKESLPDVIALVKEDMAYNHGCTNFAQYAESRLIEDFAELPKNFTMDERGIGFLFNAYEIACYAEGDIRGFVGWERLKPYIKPDFTLPGATFCGAVARAQLLGVYKTCDWVIGWKLNG